MRAAKVIPAGLYGHLGPAEGCFIPIDAYPLFSKEAKGSHFWDADGNEFIDYMCAYGPNVLGYNDEEVDAAAFAQSKLGNCVTSPMPVIIDLAELMVETVEMADWAFFAKNGGDVTSFALMVARAATGRKKAILVNGNYHGVAPWTQKVGCPGVAEEDLQNNIYVDWNNIEQVERVIKENPGEIACFMSTPYFHPVFTDNILPANGYWQKIRKLCTDNGIVLAIDDVRCGFRLDIKGSDHYYGFKADLMCFCKAIANGWNVSCLCGTDSLKEAAASVMYTGSYWMSAIPLAAGIACIKKLKRINGDKLMLSLGRKLTEGLVATAKTHGFNLVISGEPSMWFMRIADDTTLLLHQQWISECVRRGAFFTNHHNQFINCALSEADINLTLDIADDAFKAVKKQHL